jgi:hypothetical protein
VDVRNIIKKLNANKYLRTQAECKEFDNCLEELANYSKNDILEDLFLVFDDSTQEEEVMFGLVHFLEYYEMIVYLEALSNVIPKMSKNAKQWLIILNKRILNSDKYRNAYSQIIKKKYEKDKNLIFSLMKEIMNDNPDKFRNSVKEFLNNIS